MNNPNNIELGRTIVILKHTGLSENAIAKILNSKRSITSQRVGQLYREHLKWLNKAVGEEINEKD